MLQFVCQFVLPYWLWGVALIAILALSSVFRKQLFSIFPNVSESGAKWGLLQTFLSVALFFYSLSPALLQLFLPAGGGVNTMIQQIAGIMLLVGTLFFVYTAYLGWKFYQSGKTRVDNTVVLPEMNDTLKKMNKTLERIESKLDKMGGGSNDKSKSDGAR